MPVQRQSSFQPQRVAGTEAGRHDARAEQRVPDLLGDGDRRGDLDPRLTGVAGAGDGAVHTCPRRRGDGEASHGRGLRPHRRQPLGGVRTLDGEHGTCVGGLGAADRLDDPVGVRRVRHHIEHGRGAIWRGVPPDDDVVEHRSVGIVEQVRVLRPTGPDLSEVVAQRELQPLERAVAVDAHRPEVGHVEHDRVGTAGEVLGDRAPGVLQRHLPAAEGHHAGAETAMDAVERRALERHTT